MKRIAFALRATAATFVVNSGWADTRVSFGVNLGGSSYWPAPPAVIYAPAPTVVYAPPAVVVPPQSGYWRDVHVKTWVQERWIVRTNRWGCVERYCEPGYYTYTTNRVWVDGCSDPGRGHAYGYGYGSDRRYDHRGYRHDRDYSHNHGWNR